ncbi:MAG: hypothetical protein KF726_15250 [Anaerolineae bacterium]|nr:hypothetical protein [Anaerolineae bacterium]
MRWLIRRMIALTLIGSLCLLTVRVVGGTRSNPILALFTNPNDTACEMPCLFGIRPGVTRLAEAVQLIRTHPLTGSMKQIPWGEGGLFHNEVGLFVAEANDQVVLLRLYTNASRSNFPADPPMNNPDQVVIVKLDSLDRQQYDQMMWTSPHKGYQLPALTSELRAIWQRATFKRVLATLGAPQTVSLPQPSSYYVQYGRDFLYLTYQSQMLQVAFAGNGFTLNWNENYFSCIEVTTITERNLQGCAIGHPDGDEVPYLGMALRSTFERRLRAN